MIHCKSLREASKKFKDRCPSHVDHNNHTQLCGCGLAIWHKKGTKTWWIGTYLDWLNK